MIRSRSVASAAGYDEAELQAQVDSFPVHHATPITIEGRTTTEGQQVVNDASAYSEGVNAYATEAAIGGGHRLGAEGG